MGTWLNSDGLYIKYGTDAGVSTSRGGVYEMDGPELMATVELDLLNDLATGTAIMNDSTVIPSGAMITRVQVITEVAATSAGSTATLNLGLTRLDRTTAIDTDGLLVAFPISQMNTVGETSTFYSTFTVPASLTGTGALIGTVTTNPGLICADWETQAFTAGRVVIQIYYRANPLLTN